MTSNNALFVLDPGNNRIMVWSPLPAATAMGTAASFVLGQAGFNLGSSNAGGSPSAQTLSVPSEVATDGISVGCS